MNFPPKLLKKEYTTKIVNDTFYSFEALAIKS